MTSRNSGKATSPAFMRSYALRCAAGNSEHLADALVQIVDILKRQNGLERAEIFRSEDDPCAFLFQEVWVSRDCYDSASAEIGKSTFAAVAKFISGKPESHAMIRL